MPWLIIRLRHLLCTFLYLLSRLSPLLLSLPTSDLPLSSLPCSRKELHVLSFHKSLPFLLPMPWLIIRLRHLLCTCQSCPPHPFLYTCSPLSCFPFPLPLTSTLRNLLYTEWQSRPVPSQSSLFSPCLPSLLSTSPSFSAAHVLFRPSPSLLFPSLLP